MGKMHIPTIELEGSSRQVEEILDIIDKLTEYEYLFIMDISENGYLSEKQENLVTEIYYKYIGKFQ